MGYSKYSLAILPVACILLIFWIFRPNVFRSSPHSSANLATSVVESRRDTGNERGKFDSEWLLTPPGLDRAQTLADVEALAGLARPGCDQTLVYLEEVRTPQQLHCLGELGWVLRAVPCLCLIANPVSATGITHVWCEEFAGETIPNSHEAAWDLHARCLPSGRLELDFTCNSTQSTSVPAGDTEAVFALRELIAIECPWPTGLSDTGERATLFP